MNKPTKKQTIILFNCVFFAPLNLTFEKKKNNNKTITTYVKRTSIVGTIHTCKQTINIYIKYNNMIFILFVRLIIYTTGTACANIR